MASPTLKLGALQNKITAGNEQEQARNMALANNLQLGAQLISGQGFQAGMSPFEQVAQGALLGASQGFKNKAEMKKAQAQDEYNAWLQELQNNEVQLQESEAYAAKVKESMERAALPYAAARIAYGEGKMNKEEYAATLKNIAEITFMHRGEELVSAQLEGDNPDLLGIVVRDPDTGNTTTRVQNLTELSQAALAQDAEIGRALLAAQGRLPSGYFDKKSATGSDEISKLADYRKALSEAQTPEERAAVDSIFGVKREKSSGVSSARERILGSAGSEETQKEDAEILNGFDQRAVSANALKRLQQGLAEGIRTGGLTELTADSISVVNTLLGTNMKMPADIAEFRSLLKDQLGSALQIYGSGTAISNRDVISAEQTIGTVDTPKEALQKILASMSARLEATDEYANELEQLMLEEDAGRITPAESDARRAKLRTKFRARIEELYNQKLDESLAMEQNFMRTGSISGVMPAKEQIIDLDGNIIQ